MIERIPLPTFPWDRPRGAATPPQTRTAPWLIWGLPLLCLLILLTLYQSSHTEASRQRIRRLQQRHIALEQRNAQLVREIAPWESLDWVHQRAQELGFVVPAPEATLYLALETSRPQPTLSPVPGRTVSGRQNVQRWLARLRMAVAIPPSSAEARAVP